MKILLIMVATLFLPVEDISMDFNCTVPDSFYFAAPHKNKRQGK